MKKPLPDFDSLTDRLINEPADEPMLVIKTKFDPKQITEENPYAQRKETVSKTFTTFFQGEEP
ncbi:hypothetical protein SAMN05192569_101117 [Parageobacillus thermantarcticus]|uniref:Uncharacterized protein n=1 Tax=Parageobacillus thermantarcticus TaxID=186116 RepID=A0A1I0T2T6_9BACL|nr:hypothetical protein [Parageobacillus thermantarcticus]SFA46094.1 hypothetical protein SAMN05192569_101117 [Parageobacillus thermantarcticus]